MIRCPIAKEAEEPPFCAGSGTLPLARRRISGEISAEGGGATTDGDGRVKLGITRRRALGSRDRRRHDRCIRHLHRSAWRSRGLLRSGSWRNHVRSQRGSSATDREQHSEPAQRLMVKRWRLRSDLGRRAARGNHAGARRGRDQLVFVRKRWAREESSLR